MVASCVTLTPAVPFGAAGFFVSLLGGVLLLQHFSGLLKALADWQESVKASFAGKDYLPTKP